MKITVDVYLRAFRRELLPSANLEPIEETDMNWDRIEGNWKQAKGKVQEQWGKLTDDYLDKIAGKREQLVGKIQESYGIAQDEAERQVKDWEARNEAMFKDFPKH